MWMLGFEGNVSRMRKYKAEKKDFSNRAGSLIRAAMKAAQLPLDYFVIAGSDSETASPQGCRFVNTKDHRCNRGEQSNGDLGGVFMVNLEEDSFRCVDIHGNRLPMNECIQQCADVVARNRHKCTSGMWMGVDHIPKPNPAVGVDPGYPFQDWITFSVRTEPYATCVCIRTSGRLFGNEQIDLIQTQDGKLNIWPYSDIVRDSQGQVKWSTAESYGDTIGCYARDTLPISTGSYETLDECKNSCRQYRFFGLWNIDEECKCGDELPGDDSKYFDDDCRSLIVISHHTIENQIKFAKTALLGMQGLLSKTQTYGRRNDDGPLLVKHHGFGGMAPKIRAIKFLAEAETHPTGSSEQDILSAQMHWSAVGAALFSDSDASIIPRRHRCHDVYDYDLQAIWGKEHIYAEYPETDCMQPPHREAPSVVESYSLKDAKANCDVDPTCRAVSCDRGNMLCKLSAAVSYNVAKNGNNCHIKTATRKFSGKRKATIVDTSAEDAFSTCRLVSDKGKIHKKIIEESTLGKLRNGTCKWVPVHDVGSYSKQRANDGGLSCAEAMRDIYDDACFPTVYELLNPSQRRAVCANMAGDGGLYASGCGFARPLCDAEEDDW